MQKSQVTFVACRKTLMSIAKSIGMMSKSESEAFLDSLSDEIQLLRNKDASSIAWRQAATTVGDVESYSIQKCGLWPIMDDDE